MGDKKLVYIAGPYRSADPNEKAANMMQAASLCKPIMDNGHIPVCPHTMYVFEDGVTDEEDMISITLDLLSKCDELVLCTDVYEHSEGTVGELYYAMDNGIRIYKSIDEWLVENA